MAAIPRSAACGLAPLASHRAMNWGGTSTSRTLDGWNGLGLGHDGTPFRPTATEWAPLAITDRIARRRVKVCAVRTTGPRRLDLDAPMHGAMNGTDNGGTLFDKSVRSRAFHGMRFKKTWPDISYLRRLSIPEGLRPI